MKFSEKLNVHLTPEWRQQYISYRDLKNMIQTALENAPIPETTTPNVIETYWQNVEEDFFIECEKQLRKVNTFYAEKFAEAVRRNENLIGKLNLYLEEYELKKAIARPSSISLNTTRSFARKSSLHVRPSLYARSSVFGDKKLMRTQPSMFAISKGEKKEFLQNRSSFAILNELKVGFSELYLSLVLLQNYQVLNYTGFRKILKKHDKLLHNSLGYEWFNQNVEPASFYENGELNSLIKELEDNFTEYLENGDREMAMKHLRVPPLKEDHKLGTVLRVGYFLGASSVLYACIYLNPSFPVTLNYFAKGLLLFRGTFFVIIHLFLLSLNVMTWRYFGVNHILIFAIDPNQNLTSSQLTEVHALFVVLWCFCVLGYLHFKNIIFPLVIFLILIGFLLMPFPMLHRSGRMWLIKLMFRVCAAPLFPVGFADFWLGDQLTSLALGLVDLKNLIYFYANNHIWTMDQNQIYLFQPDPFGDAIIRMLPSWFRFAQGLRRYYDTGKVHPFLINAGKYASMFPVIIFSYLMDINKDQYKTIFENPFVWWYIGFSLFQTCYAYTYDILMDFGLLKIFSGTKIFLREHILYPDKFYFFVILENLILRFFWAISLYFVHQNIASGVLMDTVGGMLEIVRRYLWNHIRLENEHLFNCGQFRTMRDIFIAPIEKDKKSESALMRMMDEDEGITNRLTNSNASRKE